MTKVVVIGGSGHIGTFLVPRLVEAGFDVVTVSRGRREPYRPHAAWHFVEQIEADREAEEKTGGFGARIRALKPDIVIDNICFSLASAQHLVDALEGEVQHFLHVGTIWVHGHSVCVPTTEMQPRRPFGEYGIQKAAIESYLLERARRDGFPATILHPGHIIGPGWAPLNPAGHFDPQVFSTLARGEELALPNFGLETVHHVHADDIVLLMLKAIASRSTAIGEAFHAVSPAALTLRGYAEQMAAWFGKEPRLVFQPWEQWRAGQTEENSKATWEHIARSPNCSMLKAERLLDFRPRYSSIEGVCDAVAWLIEKGIVAAG